MDLLKSTALPALLVLLMTSIGWLLDRSIDRLGTVYFVEYDDSTATSGGKAEFRLDDMAARRV